MADILTEMTEDTEDTAESLVLKFGKPYTFDGTEYIELDLSGLEDTKASDLSAVNKQISKSISSSLVPEMTIDFAQYMAARITKKPVEFFKNLPAREAIKLKTIVVGFLYGGDGDN
jgi:hypothetical protein